MGKHPQCMDDRLAIARRARLKRPDQRRGHSLRFRADSSQCPDHPCASRVLLAFHCFHQYIDDCLGARAEFLWLVPVKSLLKEGTGVGANVRRAGGDMQPGELMLPQGTVIRPAEIAVLATLGHSRVKVIRRPRVAVLATGDELVDIDEPLSPGKIRNSNEYSNAALVARYGGTPVRLGIARDTVADLTARIHQGLAEGVDLFITSAGVSVGDYDVVKDVLKAEGEIRLWKVKMKPGKPLAFGTIQGVPLLGLPGNPTSSMVSFEQFARPAILKMQGRTKLTKPTVQAILDDPLRRTDRRGYQRVIVHRDSAGVYRAGTAGLQVSGFISAMARANGLAIVPEGEGVLSPGTPVKVQMLDWPEVE